MSDAMLVGRRRSGQQVSPDRGPQPSCSRASSWSTVSMPSAVTVNPERLGHRDDGPHERACPRRAPSSRATNDRSIFKRSTGNWCRYASDEYPVPKSSTAIERPCPSGLRARSSARLRVRHRRRLGQLEAHVATAARRSPPSSSVTRSNKPLCAIWRADRLIRMTTSPHRLVGQPLSQLAKCLLDHPEPDVDDQPAVLGHADELARAPAGRSGGAAIATRPRHPPRRRSAGRTRADSAARTRRRSTAPSRSRSRCSRVVTSSRNRVVVDLHAIGRHCAWRRTSRRRPRGAVGSGRRGDRLRPTPRRSPSPAARSTRP